MIDDRPMINLRAFVFTEADQHHFHQTTFNFTCEPGVWLDSTRDKHMVCTVGVLVEMDCKSFGRLRDNDRFHTGSNFTAAKLRRDSITTENLQLSLCCSSSVAPHGRDDKRARVELFEMLDDGFQDLCNMGNPTASGGDRDRFPGLYSLS